jgi:hypothetical protein
MTPLKKLFACSFILLLVLSVSCKKIAEAIFPAQDITLEDIAVTVPPIPFADSAVEIPVGTFTTYINTDSIIRAKTSGLFGINAVNSIKIKQVDIEVSNADSVNNLSAFKSFRIAITSNTNSTPLDIAQIEIPAWADSSYTAVPSNAPDITSYLHGTQIAYTIYCRIRNTTTKALNLSSTLVARAE